METSILGKLLTPQEREERFNLLKKQEEEARIAKANEIKLKHQQESEARLKQDIIEWINLNSNVFTKLDLQKSHNFDGYGCSDEFLKSIENELLTYNYKMKYGDNFFETRDYCTSLIEISSL